MKLLMIFPSTVRGGVEEYNLTVTAGAVQRSWDVHAAFPQAEGTLSLIRDFQGQGVQYHPLAIEEDQQDSAGVRRHFPRFLRTVRLLQRLRPDVVQVTLPYPTLCFGSILACALLKIPTVVRFGLVPPEALPINPWRPKLYAWARSRCQQWITISENNRKLVCQLFQIPEAEVLCIYNGTKVAPAADLAFSDRTQLREQVRQEWGLPPTARLALTVGRLAPQKGYDDLIPVIPQIVRDYPDIWFAWVGEGQQRDELLHQVQEQGVADRVLFLGYRADVPRLLNAADFFVFPTRFEGGQSFALAEAMAYGLPIITSDASGIPEVIHDRVHGLMFPTGDREGLLHALRWALQHPQEMQVMAQQAQQRAQDFTEEKMIQHYVEVWQALREASLALAPDSSPRAGKEKKPDSVPFPQSWGKG